LLTNIRALCPPWLSISDILLLKIDKSSLFS